MTTRARTRPDLKRSTHKLYPTSPAERARQGRMNEYSHGWPAAAVARCFERTFGKAIARTWLHIPSAPTTRLYASLVQDDEKCPSKVRRAAPALNSTNTPRSSSSTTRSIHVPNRMCTPSRSSASRRRRCTSARLQLKNGKVRSASHSFFRSAVDNTSPSTARSVNSSRSYECRTTSTPPPGDGGTPGPRAVDSSASGPRTPIIASRIPRTCSARAPCGGKTHAADRDWCARYASAFSLSTTSTWNIPVLASCNAVEIPATPAPTTSTDE